MSVTFKHRFSIWYYVVLAAAVIVISPAIVCTQTEEETAAKALQLFNKGQDAHEKGDLKLAVKLYGEALGVMPEFPEAEYQRGSAYRSLGDIDEAEKSFRRAVELRGDWSLALAGLGSVLVDKRDYANAESMLIKAIELDEQNFPAFTALTDLRIATKAKPEILNGLLKTVTALSSKAKPTAAILVSRGLLEKELGHLPAAKKSFQKALTLETANLGANAELAFIAISEGDTATAEEYAKKVETLAPAAEGTKLLRSRILVLKGELDSALKVLNSVEKPSPELIALREKIESGKSTDAAGLEKQLEGDPANATVLGRLCSLYRIENPGKSLEYCRRASEADPNNINHAVGYGAALVQAKSYLSAVDLFKKLTVVAPDNSTIRANLATALFQLKRFAEAKTEYQWLVEKQPGLAAAYYFLAVTHDQLGEFLDAMANYQQYIRLADATANKLEIEKVNLRLPILQKQIKDGKGKKNNR
ncbi:MAG: tetratricopeptide repeat protein [Blastocatellia bacterium]